MVTLPQAVLLSYILDSHLLLVLLFLSGHIAHLGIQKAAVLPVPSASTLHAHAMLTAFPC